MRGFFALRKHVTIGVDVGHTHLRLVKVAKASEDEWRLLDHRTFPYNAPNFEKSPDFPDFLRTSLIEFGASVRNVSLWTTMSSAQADVRHVRIPRVAKNQIYTAVYWTVKKELQFDEKESLFDFELQGDVVEKGIPKTSVVVYIVPRQDLKTVTDRFASVGFRPAGITIPPFAIQNLFRSRCFPDQPPAAAVLYIGNNFSRIDIMCNGNLVLTRGIKTGVGSMIEAIQETYNEERNQISIDMSDGNQLSLPVIVTEQKTMDTEEARKVFFCFTSPSEAGDAELASLNLDRWKVMQMIEPALERLVRQMERTFDHYLSAAGNEPVERIYISGMVSACKGINDFIGQQLGLEKEILDPLNPALPIQSDVSPPDSSAERVNFTAALGLALADNQQTPNGIFTFQDKEKREKVSRINRGILVAFIAVMCALMGVFYWQGRVSVSKQAQIATLQKQLAQFGEMVDPNTLLMIADKVKSRQQILKQKSRKYVSVVVMNELSHLTPPNIRFLSVTTDFGPLPFAQPTAPAPAGQPPARTKSLVVEGIVRGDRQTLESLLARYAMKLGASQLFVDPTYTSSFETFETEGEVLRFTLNLGMV